LPSPLYTALKGRCPACGEGPLFSGLLAVHDRCEHCNLSLREHEKGDGPAILTIFLVGALTTALAAGVELGWAPPYWVYVVIWPPLILGLSLFFLRFFKALIIAAQYRHLGLK